MSAKTVYLVWGSPTTPDKEEEVREWYEPHLIEMCTLPGLISAQLFQPSIVQLPRTTITLPRTMALYEFDTDDLGAAFKTLWASSLTRRIAPPADDVFTLDPQYQSAVYDFDSEYPESPEPVDNGDGLPPLPPARQNIMLVFGSATSPEAAKELERWYGPHLMEMCSLPGIISSQLYRPSTVQLPRLTTTLPGTMALYEFDTDDLPGAIEANWAAHKRGTETGVFEPGLSTPPPPGWPSASSVFDLDPVYHTVIYELVSQWPKPAVFG